MAQRPFTIGAVQRTHSIASAQRSPAVREDIFPMTSTLPAPIDKLAIVVVTYKRQELLANLFDSMTELTATLGVS